MLLDSSNDNQQVLVFTGNGAICSNSKTTLGDVANLHFDYIGMPSKRNNGLGGDGSTHSVRNRKAVLDAIRYRTKTGKPYNGEERDDIFFLNTLIEMNNDNKERNYRIATKDDTLLLGGITPALSKMTAGGNNDTLKKEAENAGPPLMISGTIPQLSNDARHMMLDLCPELKVIFPSELVKCGAL